LERDGAEKFIWNPGEAAQSIMLSIKKPKNTHCLFLVFLKLNAQNVYAWIPVFTGMINITYFESQFYFLKTKI